MNISRGIARDVGAVGCQRLRSLDDFDIETGSEWFHVRDCQIVGAWVGTVGE